MSPAGKAFGRILLVALGVALVSLPGRGAPAKGVTDPAALQKQAEERLRRDVTFLASDECEGRGPTTAGLNKAADYVSAQFKKAGLKPGFKGGWFQPFPLAGAQGKVILTGPRGQKFELKQGTDFYPLGNNQEGKATGGVVFAGYGVTSKTPPYDDYAGIDVKGKVVVLLRDTPLSAKARESKDIRSQAPLIAKINSAQKKGAVAVLLVNDAETANPKDHPPDFSCTRLDRGKHLLAVAMLRGWLQKMLPAGKTLANIEKGIEDNLKPDSFELTGWTATVEVTLKKDMLELKNVVGVLEGAGPLAQQTVIVGAHYDHLGYGGPSSLFRSKKRAIHHGADDNASGTAAIIELARRFAAMPNRQGRRLVFLAFSGEELGLLGSDFYCKNPIFPLKDTAAMFNLDMVSRLRKDKKTDKWKLLSEGHGTAKPFKELIDNLAKKYDLTLSSQASGYGPSDHMSFTEKKIPVLFFWTGDHSDYHRPSDTADKINAAGMKRVVDVSEEVIAALAKMDKPAFVEVPGGNKFRPTSGPRLGIRPGYGADSNGMEVKEVTAGGVADKAGMKAGDVIVNIAGKPIKDIGAYMQVLSTQKKGSIIEVIVLRNGKKVPLKAKLE